MWLPVLLSMLTQDPVPLVARRGQWPLLVLPSHLKKEYALLKNNVLKLMACAISGDAIVRFVSLPRCKGLVSRPIVKAKKKSKQVSRRKDSVMYGMSVG